MKTLLFSITFSLALLTGCIYKMPTSNTMSTSPNVNNPAYTREKPASFIPGK